MNGEKEMSVKCPSCGAPLKLEAASADMGSDKPAMPHKPNAAKMPMDSLKQSLMPPKQGPSNASGY